MSPKDNNKQVSAAVRILQQKRDASARATHLMVKNDPLITYEKAFLGQAAVKKFFAATFLERKKMSTKTSFKRIALVAASALALGGFSVISAPQASAATNDVLGIGVGSSARTAAQVDAFLTPGTVSIPVQATVVGGSTVHLGVNLEGTATSGETITAYSTADFATTVLTASAGITGDSVTSTLGGTIGTITAQAAAGNTYYKIGRAELIGGFLQLTTSNMLATTYDGTVGGLGSAAPSAVAGPSNTVVLTVAKDSAKRGSVVVTGAGSTITFVGSTAQSAGTTSAIIATGSGVETVTITTPTAGSITATHAQETAASSGIYSTTLTTVAVTVAAVGSSGILSAANSTVYDTSTTGSAATANLTAATGLATVAASTPVIRYDWALKDALKAAFSLSVTKTASVVITGPGLLDTGATHAGTAAKALALSSGSSGTFYVYGDGTTGVSTITFSQGSTVVATKTLTFYSSTPATYTATVVKATVDGDTAYGTGVADDSRNGAIKVVATDKSGNAIPGAAAPTVTSTSTILSVGCGSDGIDTCTADSSGVFYFFAKSTTKETYGPATVTFTSPDTLVKATATLTWSSKLATTATITGPSEAVVGDPLSFTVTLKDAKGYAVPDGLAVSNWVASATTTAGVGTPVFTGKTAAGVATITASGAIVATEKAQIVFTRAGTAATLDAYNLKADAATKVTVDVALSSTTDATASLALDAANAATDAANNAYDEAQNATQAASDALAAVTALAAQVKSLIDMVKKLTAAVAKLKK